jgi:phenylacetate-CoA ligase
MGQLDQLEPIEKASVDELRALQLDRLRWTLSHAYDKVPHYRNVFDAAGFRPGDLKSLADLAKLPFTTKKELRENYPFGMFAVPMQDIVRVHASSGTSTSPTATDCLQEAWARTTAPRRWARR